MVILTDFRRELRDRVNFLREPISIKCKNCGEFSEFDTLNYFLYFASEDTTRCSHCKEKYPAISFEKGIAYLAWYQILFLRGIYLLIFQRDVRSTIIEIFTSLEVFLSDVLYEMLRRRKKLYRPIIGGFLSGDIELHIGHYKKIFKNMRLKITRGRYMKIFEERFKRLYDVQRIRNDVVHRGIWPSYKEVKSAILRVGDIFNLLEEYY